jgi:F-type H+-transporting ATPase subunit epsilon
MTLHVQVVSPERVLWSGDAERVITRTSDDGDIAFLTGHTPFMASLGSGLTEILQDGGSVVRVAVHGGFVEVSGDRVSILSDVAEVADDIDAARAERAKEQAERRLRDAPSDDDVAALQRAETRLRAVAG